jgi:cell division protein FtsL
MLIHVFAILCGALTLFLAWHWMRVTVRDRDASRLRRMRESVDWHRPGHRSRIAAGASHFGEVRVR